MTKQERYWANINEVEREAIRRAKRMAEIRGIEEDLFSLISRKRQHELNGETPANLALLNSQIDQLQSQYSTFCV